MKKNSLKRRSGKALLTTLLCFALIFTACVTSFSFKPFANITASAAEGGDTPTLNRYETEYESLQDVLDDATEHSKKIGAEGIVLLKNEDNALPIYTPQSPEGRKTANKPKISLFGKNSVNAVYSGSGSSGGVSGDIWDFVRSFEGAGYELNKTLDAFYRDNAASGPVRGSMGFSSFNYHSYFATAETPQNKYTDTVKNSYAAYGDAAVVVFSRTGGEGADLPRTSYTATKGDNPSNANARNFPTREQIEDSMDSENSYEWTPVGGFGRESDPFEHYLELDDNEEALLDELQNNNNFDKIIVILNSSNAMEAGFLNDPKYSKIKAAFWAPGGGVAGYEAFGKIFNGTVNPSGRTADTFAADFTADPTWNNYDNNFVGNMVKASTDAATGNQYSIYNKTTESVELFLSDDANFGAPFYEVSYEEGIYSGYRYWETRGYTENTAAATKDYKWYDDNVVYPFGYGISYTSFSWKADWKNTAITKEGKISVDITVKNEGAFAGKDVVQLYYTAPYTAGGIEKAYVELGGFAKTGIIQPGGTETVNIEMNVFDMASFDTYDLNKNEKKLWELDAGSYTFRLGRNANDAWTGRKAHISDSSLTKAVSLAAVILYDKDPVSGAPVEERFEEMNKEMKDRLLSRNDWKGTWPSRPLWFDVNNDTTIDPFWAAWYRTQNEGKNWTSADTSVTPVYLKKGKAELIKDEAWLYRMVMPLTDESWSKKTASSTYLNSGNQTVIDPEWDKDKPWYTDTAPALRTEAAYSLANPAPIQLADLAGVPLGDPKWDAFAKQMTLDQMYDMNDGRFRSNPLVGLGVPMMNHADGPLGISRAFGGDSNHNMFTAGGATNVPFAAPALVACTWNREVARDMGRLVGEHGLWINLNGWYAPGANIHRSPFSGRNFEYYSECGVLSGVMMTEVVAAAAEKGLISFMKHFVLNDQENNRDTNGVATWADEQTLRQIYALPFEKAIKATNKVGTENDGIGAPAGLMSSFNRIGPDWCGASYELLTELVRGEWGMQGIIITDAHSTGEGCMSANQMVRAGNDLSLDGYNKTAGSAKNISIANITNSTEANTPTQLNAVYECAKRVFWSVLNSSTMVNGYGPENFGTNSTANPHLYATNYTEGGANANGRVSIGTVTLGQTLSAANNIKVTASGAAFAGKQYTRWMGKLPQGLTLNLDGTITGTVASNAAPGNYDFQAGIMLGEGAEERWTVTNAIRFFRIVVARPDLEFTGTTEIITTALNRSFAIDVSFVASANGDQPASLTYVLEGAPVGVYISSQGRLYGSVSAEGTYSVNVKASDSSGKKGEKVITIYAGAVAFTAPAMPAATVGMPYIASLAKATVSNIPGGVPITYTTTAVLPAGLTLSSDGTIMGTPTAASNAANYLITANAGIYGTVSVNVSIRIDAAATVIPPLTSDETQEIIDGAVDGLKDEIDGKFDDVDDKIGDLEKKVDDGLTDLEKKLNDGLAGVEKKVDDGFASLKEEGGCNSSLNSAGFAGLFSFASLILAAAVIMIVRRKKSANK